jgi:hypothetical protein
LALLVSDELGFTSRIDGGSVLFHVDMAAMRHTTFIAVLFAATFMGCTKHAETRMSPSPIHWPSLADYPSISGRAATTNDVAANRAVFVLESNGQVIGHPLDIKIPQYAFHIDEQTQKRTPCIIIQAEEARGQQIIGGRMLPDGSAMAALYREFEFLGDTPPKTE